METQSQTLNRPSVTGIFTGTESTERTDDTTYNMNKKYWVGAYYFFTNPDSNSDTSI